VLIAILRYGLTQLVMAIRRLFPGRVLTAIKNEYRYQELMESAKRREDGRVTVSMVRVSKSLEVTPENETEIVLKLSKSFNAAKQKQRSLPKCYLPDHEWKRILEVEWQHCYDALSRSDVPVVASFLKNFFRNQGISGFWGGTEVFEIFRNQKGKEAQARNETMIRQFYAWLSAFPSIPLSELDAPKIGNPWGFDLSGNLLVEPVFEYHFQANYFRRLLSEIKAPVVLEIGGGFGGLAFQLLKGGGQVKYVGIDLPENILIQSYYLSCAFPNARMLTYSSGFAGLDENTLNEYDIVMLPNFVLPNLATSMVDLIVNVRSLSEMSEETIEEYMKQVDRIGRLFFFHENIYAPRKDELFGVPSSRFPVLHNFQLISASESRWPKYQSNSLYPCQENLFIHRSAINGIRYSLESTDALENITSRAPVVSSSIE
jgi:putative sugar O-methyltransferase